MSFSNADSQTKGGRDFKSDFEEKSGDAQNGQTETSSAGVPLTTWLTVLACILVLGIGIIIAFKKKV